MTSSNATWRSTQASPILSQQTISYVWDATGTNLSVVRDVTEDAITANRDSEFESLITEIKNSLPMMPFTISEESKLIDIALTFTVIGVAEDLKEDRATSLPCAYSRCQSTGRQR